MATLRRNRTAVEAGDHQHAEQDVAERKQGMGKAADKGDSGVQVQNSDRTASPKAGSRCRGRERAVEPGLAPALHQFGQQEPRSRDRVERTR